MVAGAGKEGMLDMKEFLLKETCYLLYRLVHQRDDVELSREDYLKNLEERFLSNKKNSRLVAVRERKKREDFC